jgi:hypothetical protein
MFCWFAVNGTRQRIASGHERVRAIFLLVRRTVCAHAVPGEGGSLASYRIVFALAGISDKRLSPLASGPWSQTKVLIAGNKMQSLLMHD